MKWPFKKTSENIVELRPASLSMAETEDAVMHERLQMAAEWLKRMPHFPPNCERLHIQMKYDDGKILDLEIGQQDAQ